MARFGYVCRLRTTRFLAKVPCSAGFLRSLQRAQSTAQKTACLLRTWHTYTNIHTHIDIHYIYIYICIHIYIYMCMYVCVHIYIYICTYEHRYIACDQFYRVFSGPIGRRELKKKKTRSRSCKSRYRSLSHIPNCSKSSFKVLVVYFLLFLFVALLFGPLLPLSPPSSSFDFRPHFFVFGP